MAFDADLAERVRDALPAGVIEKHMFGSLGFMVHGHLAVALGRDDLLARIGDQQVAEAVAIPGVCPAVMGQRTMSGWVRVDNELLTGPAGPGPWVDRAVAFVATLPAR